MLENCSPDPKELTSFHDTEKMENKYKLKANHHSLLQQIYASENEMFERSLPSHYTDPKQRMVTNEELLQNLRQNASATRHKKQVIENQVQEHIDKPSKVSDRFRYQERFMKRAITGIF